MDSSGIAQEICVIGLGRLGLCLALCLEEAGFLVHGVDVSPEVIHQVNTKTMQSKEPSVQKMLASSTKLTATQDLRKAAEAAGIILILVDTPSTGTDFYDVTKLGRVLASLNALRLSNKHISICSTVLPGYAASIGRFLLRDCENVSLSYTPEFIAQGEIIHGLVHPDMILIGEGSRESGDALEEIFRAVSKNEPVVSRMSVESAEITKIALNCFVTMKIAYANHIADVADKTPQAEKEQVLLAIGSDSRVGTKCMKPGYGFGGPCFPRDNRAFGQYAASVGIEPLLAKATDAANASHALLQAEALLKLDLPCYVFEDVAFKSGCPVPIIEESQKLEVARMLATRGKSVIIRDREEILEAVKLQFGAKFLYEDTTLFPHCSHPCF